MLLLEIDVWETTCTDIPLYGFGFKKRMYFTASYCNYRKMTSNNPAAFGNQLFSHTLNYCASKRLDNCGNINKISYQFVL